MRAFEFEKLLSRGMGKNGMGGRPLIVRTEEGVFDIEDIIWNGETECFEIKLADHWWPIRYPGMEEKPYKSAILGPSYNRDWVDLCGLSETEL